MTLYKRRPTYLEESWRDECRLGSVGELYAHDSRRYAGQLQPVHAGSCSTYCTSLLGGQHGMYISLTTLKAVAIKLRVALTNGFFFYIKRCPSFHTAQQYRGVWYTLLAKSTTIKRFRINCYHISHLFNTLMPNIAQTWMPCLERTVSQDFAFFKYSRIYSYPLSILQCVHH